MMNLHTNRPVHRPDGTLPLINIVLLLVLAFMISGTIDTPMPDGFDPLQSSRGTPGSQTDEALNLIVSQSGEIWSDGNPVAGDDLTPLFISAARSDRSLVVKADTRASANQIVSLLSSAEDAGVKDAIVMTIQADQ